ncbi:hypothetical protein SAMN05192553_10546 [Cyclobacterium xiamenense]|uniref:Uncharacterized protein n=1 Tax=Cyclobacterium xiamenense TaxID=1297121 RepID=A0A1H6ZZX1_9BACT|nr:hypothetical protein SAMN05192553_10546 [Cyclobacterium xiamenense]
MMLLVSKKILKGINYQKFNLRPFDNTLTLN